MATEVEREGGLAPGESVAYPPRASDPPVEEVVKGETHAELVTDAPEPEPEEVHQTGYALYVPVDIPVHKLDDESVARFHEYEDAANAAGVPQHLAQGLVESFADAHSALGADNVYDLSDPDAGEATLKSHWGEMYPRMMSVVKKNATALGESFKAYLDETGLGNDPRVCVALANLHDLQRATPAEAEGEIQKLMRLPEYTSPDRQKRNHIVARIAALSRIAYRDESIPIPSNKPSPNPSAVNDRAYRAELTALASKKSLTEADKARWADLIAKV